MEKEIFKSQTEREGEERNTKGKKDKMAVKIERKGKKHKGKKR